MASVMYTDTYEHEHAITDLELDTASNLSAVHLTLQLWADSIIGPFKLEERVKGGFQLLKCSLGSGW